MKNKPLFDKSELFFIVIVLSFAFLTGCVHLPKETVQLSGEMGTMIQGARDAHMKLLASYEEESRGRIDDYMETTGIPDILTKMNEKGDLFGSVCDKNNGKHERIKELQGFVEAAAASIFELRKEMTDRLDAIMARKRSEAEEYFNTLFLSNKAVTDNLQAIRNNDEVMENVLKIKPDKFQPLKKESEKLDNYLNKKEKKQ